MEQHKSTFQKAFAYVYFLMLSADKIADLSELELGNKIIAFENMNKTEVMKLLDVLSSTHRDQVMKDGINLLKSLSKMEQLKCLGYVKLIAMADGNYDESESNLLNDIGTNKLNILPAEIQEFEYKLKQSLSNLNV